LFTTLKGYSKDQLLADLTAGVIVGIVALPLAIAFAIASGVTPERGLYTAIIGGFIISALGGSRVQIGGPTGAFVVIVAGIVQRYGQLGHSPRAMFDLMLKYAISEDGSLHAEKYYRTTSQEFGSTRSAFRWRQLVALSRVTASECGRPAAGMAEAREMLGV